ncbi:MAG TPA: hypothetical protein VK686_18445 [Bryobacteraceae bacterium]|nr:hypothetical protein [Bryobacteraceae bacterium]
MRVLGTVIVAIIIGGSAPGQTLVGTGYDDPSLIAIAPGQVVPLVLTGLTTVLPAGTVRAQQIPLPTSQAGISVTLNQPPAYTRALPLIAIDQFNHCTDSTNPTPDCLVTAITVQIPFDILIPNPLIEAPVSAPQITSLVVAENGSVTKSFTVSPVPDQIHVLQSCDIGGQTEGSGVCFPIVTHGDGSLVLQAPRAPGQPALSNSEARPSEELVVYAYGLGQVSPAVQAGSASPNPPAVVTAPIYLQFDYRPNASASMPILNSSLTTTAQPVFAGLVPGQVGLYQINFVVPPPPAGTSVCGAPVESNLTVSISAADGQSFSGAAICVDTGSQ